MENHEMKLCPFCGEEIKVKAIKCRYCHSSLDEENAIVSLKKTDSRSTINNNKGSIKEKVIQPPKSELSQETINKENDKKKFKIGYGYIILIFLALPIIASIFSLIINPSGEALIEFIRFIIGALLIASIIALIKGGLPRIGIKNRTVAAVLLVIGVILSASLPETESERTSRELRETEVIKAKVAEEAYINDFKNSVEESGIASFVYSKSAEYEIDVFFIDLLTMEQMHFIQSNPKFSRDEKELIEGFINNHKTMMSAIFNNSEVRSWVVDNDTFDLGKKYFKRFDKPISALEKAYEENDIKGMRDASLRLNRFIISIYD